ncbi:phosphoenolpyruvate--protein phosphotransferase [Brevundimonas sp. BAL450]|uniref:phosphoenolpyruvate--protein phosphotransferase n=1 Tax=Brevundimonas sp. BAL450 TaxID=1708162 RepID=UPI0018CB55D8|nr:phosphoenolpyruvate--protein phosphotransferase [Brevundimonas sp. BAL450]MBG7614046.1 phosphoenolpyruvate--protein phosphotransferase [Brevundimonas sp. BAL450]
MTDIVLVAPMAGWAAPLSEAPDPVFAERMMGDGVAVDPIEGVLRAPCDGVVTILAPALHAVTLRGESGVEVLMHIGLETVALKGEGFTARVIEGQAVKAGDPLIEFDLDLIGGQAKSLITPIIITNGEAFEVANRVTDREVQAGDPLMTLRASGRTGPVVEAAGVEAERKVVTPLAHGIHARPAARIAALAKGFDAEVTVAAFNRRSSARSPVGVMALAIRHGDAITLSASGPDAARAVEALAELIEGGMGEAGAAPAAKVTPEPVPRPRRALHTGVLRGVTAAPGVAIGQAARLIRTEIEVSVDGRGASAEHDALNGALETVRERLQALTGGDATRGAIAGAHLAFLDDPELLASAQRGINEGRSAGHAWRTAIDGFVQALNALGDRRMAERVDDLKDLERQVLAVLTGEGEGGPDVPQGAVVIAEELAPSQVMALDPSRIGGLCIARGGPTSHVAILAASMGLPCLVAVGDALMDVMDGAALILDADAGTLRVSPDAAALGAAQTELARRHQRHAAALENAGEDCRLLDGTRIEVFANLGAVGEAERAVANGAEGCGLLRTEFLFLERDTAPDEDEQAAQYQAIADGLGGRPLIVRTLDAGGDKPMPYLPIPHEENPALGLRGVRVGLWRPQMLMTQLRAILRVAPAGQCKIMVPMVASPDELAAVRRMLEEARRDMGVATPVQLGVMIETPAAAVTADLIAEQADFLSIGTNDLTQYVLARDRGNPAVAADIDGLHPAVLRLIRQTCEAGQAKGRWVGVCGGLAGDMAAAPILVGLGVTELSAAPAVLPDLKALLRGLTMDVCRDLATRALACASVDEVRALADDFRRGADR